MDVENTYFELLYLYASVYVENSLKEMKDASRKWKRKREIVYDEISIKCKDKSAKYYYTK